MTLAELRALCARATPGPWIVDDHLQKGDAIKALQADGHQRQHICYASGLSSVIDDLPFIAAARTWLPALIECAETLRRIRDEVDHVGKDHAFSYCNDIARAALARLDYDPAD